MSAATATENQTDLLDEFAGAMPLTDGIKAPWFPLSRGGRPYHPLTVKRWINEGVGPQNVKLRATRFGGRFYITRSDVEAFLAELNESEE